MHNFIIQNMGWIYLTIAFICFPLFSLYWWAIGSKEFLVGDIPKMLVCAAIWPIFLIVISVITFEDHVWSKISKRKLF